MMDRFFQFNGIESSDLGIHIVSPDNPQTETPIFSSATINSQRKNRSNVIDSYSVSRDVLEFTFFITVLDKDGFLMDWTNDIKSKVLSWLVHDEYKELVFSENRDKVYYAIVTDMGDLIQAHGKGYVEITMKTNSPFAWSRETIVERVCDKSPSVFNVRAIHNIGDKYYYPDVEVQMLGDTEISIINQTDGGRETNIKKLLADENFYISGNSRIVRSGYPIRNIFSNFNRVFPRLVYGDNKIEVRGKCNIMIRSQFPIV